MLYFRNIYRLVFEHGISSNECRKNNELFRANGLVVFPTFVADISAMCGTVDLEIKSLTIRILEEPNYSVYILFALVPALPGWVYGPNR